MEWISVEDKQPIENCLVYLEKEAFGMRVHSAKYHTNIVLIGGHFSFDMPKVTHWMPLPKPPE